MVKPKLEARYPFAGIVECALRAHPAGFMLHFLHQDRDPRELAHETIPLTVLRAVWRISPRDQVGLQTPHGTYPLDLAS